MIAGRDSPSERQEIAGEQRIGRHQHIGDEVDDEVERRARPAGRGVHDVDAPGDRAVYAVDEEGDGEPQEHAPDIALDDGDERQKAPNDPARREEMNRRWRRHGGPA